MAKSVSLELYLWDVGEVECDQDWCDQDLDFCDQELALPLPVLDELLDGADLLHVLAGHLVALGKDKSIEKFCLKGINWWGKFLLNVQIINTI